MRLANFFKKQEPTPKQGSTLSNKTSSEDVRKEDPQDQKKRREQLAKKEDFMYKATDIWVTDIIPNWKERRYQGRTRKLWKAGVPPRIRPQVWELAIGNNLQITPELFSIFQAKAIETRAAMKEQQKLEHLAHVNNANTKNYESNPEYSSEGTPRSTDEHGDLYLNKADANKVAKGREVSREESASLIELDLSRTFPQLQFFQRGGPMYETLMDVLSTFVIYRPDIGYVQGMSYITAMLLLYLDSYSSFVCLANMLGSYHFQYFFRMRKDEIDIYMEAFELLLDEVDSSLCKHLKVQKIEPQFYLMDWFITLFSKSLPLDIAVRLWDLFFLDGEAYLFRAAIGILTYFADTLKSSNFEEIMCLLTRLPQEFDEQRLFDNIQDAKITIARFDKAMKTVREKHRK